MFYMLRAHLISPRGIAEYFLVSSDGVLLSKVSPDASTTSKRQKPYEISEH